MRRKVLFIALAFYFLSFNFLTLSTVEAISPVKDVHNKTIRIAGDIHYPPYEYVDENGVFKGFNVDIMRAIAIELGLDIELKPMTWQEALIALETGKVDAIQGMT
ncbi:MAG: transporter substrate-binding domain-containing protein, partial [Eubacteriales bacterium]